MTVIVVALLLWGALLAARGTPVGRLLERWLVDAPARWLGRFSRGHVFIAAALVVFVAIIFQVFEAEGVRLLSMASPEMMGLLASAEIATWVDVLVMTTLAASTTRLGPVVARVRAIVRRPKRARRIAVRPERPAANDDDDGAAWLPLAA